MTTWKKTLFGHSPNRQGTNVNRFQPQVAGLEDRTVPAADLFADATVLTGDQVTDFGDNFSASAESGEPNHAGSLASASVWWQWTATADGNVEVNTFESSFNTVLGVYTGSSVDQLTEIASNDDAGLDAFEFQSQVTFDAVTGTTYFIAVDGFFDSGSEQAETGDIVLNLGTAPANDDFDNAIAASGEVEGTNIGATGEEDEPEHAGTDSPTNSVWYTWTAGANEPVEIEAESEGEFVPVLAVYVGDTLSELEQGLIADGDEGVVTFDAVAGTTYRIAVEGNASASGNFVLNLPESAPPPENNPPTINDAAFTVQQGAPTGTVVGTVVASDPDEGQTLVYTITEGDPDGVFAIDPDNGTITVANAAALGSSDFNLTVRVTDNGDPSLSATANVTVTVEGGTTALQLIQDMKDTVRDLVNDGELRRRYGRGLVSTLNIAERALELGRDRVAVAALQVFKTEVTLLVLFRQMDRADGRELFGMANDAIDLIRA